MTTMELTYEATQAEIARLDEQRHHWTQRREQLSADLEATQAQAGEHALAGTSTAKIAERISRMQTELQIAERALQALDMKQHEAQQAAHPARIADLRGQAATIREQAAAIKAAAEPHLAALERIEGGRPRFEQSRSIALEHQAYRIDRNIEWLESRMEERP